MTIQAALAPLLIICSFCSLGLIEYPLGQPRPYFTCLYVLTIWSLFSYFFYYLVYNSYTLSLVYLSWPNTIIMITAIVSMLVSLFRFKELKMCLHKLSVVDDTLEALGTSKEYRRLRNRIISIIFGWIILSFVLNAFDSFWLNYDYFSITCVWAPFLGNHLLHVNTLSALTWGTILRYTSSRFQQVNKHIHALYSDLLENASRTRRQNILINPRRTEAEEYKPYIWILMHVHLQLCLISRELNKVFNVQMTVQMTSYFVFIVTLCREIYWMYISKHSMNTVTYLLDGIYSYVWGTVYSIIIIVLNHVCETVYSKANEAIAILYKLSNDNFNEDLREPTLQFILQIKQTEITFGSGLCCFGNSFVRRFYKSIVTVLVIIIQMRSNTY